MMARSDRVGIDAIMSDFCKVHRAERETVIRTKRIATGAVLFYRTSQRRQTTKWTRLWGSQSCPTKLERQPESRLDDARGVGGARNLPECAAGHADGGRDEQRVLAEIERAGAELHFHVLLSCFMKSPERRK